MAGLERRFDNFQIGDNPYDLGDGAVRRLAALGGVELAAEPTSEEIQTQLFDGWGATAKTFRDNVDAFKTVVGDGDDLRGQVADIIEDSGITEAIYPRNIFGDEPTEFDVVIVAGGVYNWMKRRGELVTSLVRDGYSFETALLLGDNRPMTSPTEVAVPFVSEWTAHDDQPPTERDYLRTVTLPMLASDELPTIIPQPPEAGGLKGMVEYCSTWLKNRTVLVAQNAPAGSTFGDMRRVVHDMNLFFATDSILVARTADEESDPLHYQNAFSAPSALARWVKTVHEINQQYQN